MLRSLISCSSCSDATSVDYLMPGLVSVPCHEKFKSCIKKVKKTEKVRFSKECPMKQLCIQGIDMAILFS